MGLVSLNESHVTDGQTSENERVDRSEQILGRTLMSTGRRHYELLRAREFYMNAPQPRASVFFRRV